MKYMQLFHQIKPLFKMKKHFIRTMLQSSFWMIMSILWTKYIHSPIYLIRILLPVRPAASDKLKPINFLIWKISRTVKKRISDLKSPSKATLNTITQLLVEKYFLNSVINNETLSLLFYSFFTVLPTNWNETLLALFHSAFYFFIYINTKVRLLPLFLLKFWCSLLYFKLNIFPKDVYYGCIVYYRLYSCIYCSAFIRLNGLFV